MVKKIWRLSLAAIVAGLVTGTLACRHSAQGTLQRPVYEHARRVNPRFWNPVSAAFADRAGYLRSAVRFYEGDIRDLRSADAYLLGHLTYPQPHPVVVGSVGGTHFRVLDSESSTSESWVSIGSETTRCSSYGSTTNCTSTPPLMFPVTRTRSMYLLEVVYVPPERLNELPSHLRPTADMFN